MQVSYLEVGLYDPHDYKGIRNAGPFKRKRKRKVASVNSSVRIYLSHVIRCDIDDQHLVGDASIHAT